MMNDKEKEAWKFIAEKMRNLSELDDILIGESRDIHLAVLNLKVISAHLQSSGLANGITPVCQLIDRISNDLSKYSRGLKAQRGKAKDSISVLDEHFNIPEEVIEARAKITIRDL